MANRDAKLIERTLKDFSLGAMSGNGGSGSGSNGYTWYDNYNKFEDWRIKETQKVYTAHKEEIDNFEWGVVYHNVPKNQENIIKAFADFFAKRIPLSTKISEYVENFEADHAFNYSFSIYKDYQHNSTARFAFEEFAYLRIDATWLYLQFDGARVCETNDNNWFSNGGFTSDSTFEDLFNYLLTKITGNVPQYGPRCGSYYKETYFWKNHKQTEIGNQNMSWDQYESLSMDEILTFYEVSYEEGSAPE